MTEIRRSKSILNGGGMHVLAALQLKADLVEETHMKKTKFACALIILSALVSLPVSAQEYPSKPVKIVVGAAPGGPNDMVARMLGERLSRNMGASFVVQNK